MKYQRGLSAIHLVIFIVVAILGSIGVSAYMKESARRAEVERQRLEAERVKALAADIERKRLAAAAEKRAAGAKGGEELDAIASVVNDDWLPTLRVAESTARIALPGPVQSLQAIHKKVKGMPASGCAEEGKAQVLEHMEIVIDRFLAFMQQSSPPATWDTRAQIALDGFGFARKQCRAMAAGTDSENVAPVASSSSN